MGGPLDHPELREVEELLDAHEVGSAQALLSRLGERRDLEDGVAYLTTRLLHVRGKLDWPAVADRLRDILARSPNFAEASALLSTAERGKTAERASETPLTAKEGAAIPSLESLPKVEPPAALDITADWFEPTSARGPAWPLGGPAPRHTDTEPRAHTPHPAPRSAAPPQQLVWEDEGATPVMPVDPRSPFRTSDRPPGEKPRTQPPLTPRLGSGPPQGPAVSPQEARRRLFTPISGFDSFPGSRDEGGPRTPANPGMPVIPRAPALPQFRDNTSAPSYAPGREPEIDFVRSKSLLPAGAGRYSEQPASMDVIEPSMRKRRSRQPPNRPGGKAAPDAPVTAREGQPRQSPNAPGRERPSPQQPPATAREGRIVVREEYGPMAAPNRARTGPPPKSTPALATLFEIASWIDEGRHKDAIAAINRAGPEAGPEYSVLRARALAGAGYVDQAFDALERLEHVPALDPELKAACARLFVELGAPSRALPLARQALDAEEDRPLVLLTFALAAVRTMRREPNPEILEAATHALERVHGREGPLPALYQALRACIEATSGDPDRAISMAQRALGLDSRSPDAFAAIAEASARAGRSHGARQAWSRLAEVSIDEADALEGALAGLGVPVGARAEEREARSPVSDVPWAPIEATLASGARSEVTRALELAAHDTVRRMTKSASQSGPTAIATVAASFLTTTPVFSAFAPYDVSLWSIRRVEAAIDVIYGGERRQRGPSDDSGIVLLVGAYLGEVVRMAHGGHWEGHISDVDSLRIAAAQRHFYPFRVLTTRLRQGRRASLSEALAGSQTTTEPWRARVPNPIAPPMPWAPHAWPRPSEIGRLGRSLSQSPIGRFCEEFAEGALDRTTSSLISLDTYLELIAPRSAPADPDAAWTRRVAVFVGGYLGETLRGLVGGEWVYGVDSADDALAFKLQFRGPASAMPVAHVLERVIGQRTSSLVDYAKTMMRRAGGK